jgi:LemA protein
MPSQTALYTTFTILAGIFGFVLLWLWGAYNGFVTKKNQVKTDFADIDVQLKRRASLIENLANVVKGYAKHEEETFKGVAAARAALDTSKGAADSAKADNMLSSTLRSLFAVVENYPKLQANENFIQLQNDLRETENYIARVREEYNQTVRNYNNRVQTFPNLLAAALFGFKPEEMFSAPEAVNAPILS